MMSEQKGNVIRQVLNLIEYGNISQTEAVQRLEAMIQSEIEKQDESADMELVTACEELLWQINTHGTASSCSCSGNPCFGRSGRWHTEPGMAIRSFF